MSWERPAHRKRWENMVERCHNEDHQDYKFYGGRGITVCPQWKEDWRVFQAWCFATYQQGKTLDRIDNNGPYSPENCCWSTAREQAQNRRLNTEAHRKGREAFKKVLHERYGDPLKRPGKICSKCGEWKTNLGFHKEKRRADGLQGQCKSCSNKPHEKRDKVSPRKGDSLFKDS